MVKRQFDFESTYKQLEDKIEELKAFSEVNKIDLSDQITQLEKQIENMRLEKYQNLTPWEKILLVRRPDRPTTHDYIDYLCDEFIELHGDRCYGEDRAIIGGIGMFAGRPVTIIGHQKGKDTKDNLEHNFGMPNPEGYRKTLRLLLQAQKFDRPVITFIDTPGAYPGIGAEERGQAWSISQLLMALSELKVPVIAVVTGEGGSGGALSLAVADRILMLSNAVFSVASAEACASIIWKDQERVDEMAAALKITAGDLYRLGVVDEILEEPLGGAQADFETMAMRIGEALTDQLQKLISQNRDDLVRQRYQKFRSIGLFKEN